MATVNLGNIKFKWKGTYSGGSSYTIDDVVEYNGSSYICKLASTGNLPTNTTYFDLMSQAGTNGSNGTDLTSTLTTQGDLVYRDGSGLQRLGAGTAGQVLQTGGAGANPSWSTVSSDFVKLADVNATGSSSELILDDIFSSTYDNYQIIVHPSYNGGSGSSSIKAQLRYDSSGTNTTYTSANYFFTGNTAYLGSGANGTSQFYSAWGDTYWSQQENVANNNTQNLGYFVWTMGNPAIASQATWVHCEDVSYDNNYLRVGKYSVWVNETTIAFNGLKLFAQSGANIGSGFNVKVYGLK